MKSLIIICFLILAGLFSVNAYSQNFVSIIDLNEITSLTGSQCIAKLKTGDKVEGILKGMSVTNGYISGFVVKQNQGEKKKIKTTQLASLLVKSSGFTDMATVHSGTITRNNMSLSSTGDAADAEYIVFEPVSAGKFSGELLLQLLNPDFSNKIKVYAYETDSGSSVSITDDKKGTTSYTGRAAITYLFVKAGEKPVKVQKSNFKSRLKEIFSDCPNVLSRLNDEKIRWNDLAEYVFDYDKECK
jgi:hypothetical protein